MSSLYLVLYVEFFFDYILFFTFLSAEPVGLALDLEDCRPSVLLHCWLGHLTCKMVSEMTYNVSSGTFNPTILLAPILEVRVQGNTLVQVCGDIGIHVDAGASYLHPAGLKSHLNLLVNGCRLYLSINLMFPVPPDICYFNVDFLMKPD